MLVALMTSTMYYKMLHDAAVQTVFVADCANPQENMFKSRVRGQKFRFLF